MLKLVNIVKEYPMGNNDKVVALKGVSVQFRRSEFVSILGQSGCGKTTLLNIVGGLDRYTDGDLIINGVSTKQYKDKDWDVYRNHSIGFVFQTYNLIMHLSVLENVELALTLVGIDAKERHERAMDALAKVGLVGQEHKKPNQLSGGQMQRVAIARAIINNPDILLADEPTGALDSETSVQIMEILKELAKDRLIIMVTHNPDLAKAYSTRIVRLSDGLIVDDSNPVPEEESMPEVAIESTKPQKGKTEKGKSHTSMNYLSALRLSGKNLLTKRLRTALTAVAGSIGIIGIAVVLALSSGFSTYVNETAENTLSQYPISVKESDINIGSIVQTMLTSGIDPKNPPAEYPAGKDIEYNIILGNMIGNLGSIISHNDLVSLKQFLDSNFDSRLGTVKYGYGIDLHMYTNYAHSTSLANYVANGGTEAEWLANNPNGVFYYKINPFFARVNGQLDGVVGTVKNLIDLPNGVENLTDFMGQVGSSGNMFNAWDQLPSDMKIVTNQYDLIDGKWPQEKEDLILVLDKYNHLDDLESFTLGLSNPNDAKGVIIGSMLDLLDRNGDLDPTIKENLRKQAVKMDEIHFTTQDLMRDLKYKIVLAGDYYEKDTDGHWKLVPYIDINADTTAGIREVVEDSLTLNVVGIVRQKPNVTAACINGTIGYMPSLTEWLMEGGKQTEIVRAMRSGKMNYYNTDNELVLERYFSIYTDDMGVERIGKELGSRRYYNLNDKLHAEGAKLAEAVWEFADGTSEQDQAFVQETLAKGGVGVQWNIRAKEARGALRYEFVNCGLPASLPNAVNIPVGTAFVVEDGSADVSYYSVLSKADIDKLIIMGDSQVKSYGKATKEAYTALLRVLGYNDISTPTSINICSNSFESKDEIKALLARYDDEQYAKLYDHYMAMYDGDAEKAKNQADFHFKSLVFDDTVGTLMQSVTTILKAITYVLIAFSSISLVVSSIMIAIITYTSVMERTKEIGVLRSIGARKKDISRVFNSETFIIGSISGIIAVLFTWLLSLPANAILMAQTGIPSLVVVAWWHPILLIGLSILLTAIAGFIPSRIAASKDPVMALRSE